MEPIFGCAPVAAITCICYLVAMLIKTTSLNKKYLPIICGLCGGILGIIALYMVDDYPAANVFDAIGYGVASGLAATGIHQMYKQIRKQ